MEIVKDKVQEQVMDVLYTTYDPEIPINIFELGLIYENKVEEKEDGFHVYVLMTVTSPNCPAIDHLPNEIRTRCLAIPGVVDCFVEITFDPPWTMEMMSDAARLQLGFM
jgi:FeS assembly SUF system protein